MNAFAKDTNNLQAYVIFIRLIKNRLLLQSYGTGATNVTFQQHKVGRDERAEILGRHSGFRGCTIWLTGLSGAGKTTIAFGVEKALTQVNN